MRDGLTIGSPKDDIMNKLTATILSTCMTLATAGAFAADSPSNDPAAQDAVSQETPAMDATPHDAMSAADMAKDGMKEDTMSHENMAKDEAKGDEVK
jgi:pentapeptide MXKDX repeat protein